MKDDAKTKYYRWLMKVVSGSLSIGPTVQLRATIFQLNGESDINKGIKMKPYTVHACGSIFFIFSCLFLSSLEEGKVLREQTEDS